MKKVALVTGGSRGIGLGISQHLAKEGLNLTICGLREPQALADTVNSLQNLGSDVLYVQADVSDAGARDKLLATVRSRFGRLDVLVNNAGMAPSQRADILDASEESFEQLIRVNLQGPYFLTQAAARWMIEQKKSDPGFTGCIINISSVSSTVPSVNRGEYCISKAGISMATKLWAVRLAEFGILVYEIQPGITKTDMTAGVQARYDQLIADGLLLQPRWGTPDDVGKAAVALVRGDLAYSTGQTLLIDGGLTMPRL
jgi:NAD(P)-dependent dehydrogenase (short-subunit alcohol dehydrogenase family)